jgi:hypothetical protein
VLKKPGEVLERGVNRQYSFILKDNWLHVFSIEQWNCSILGYVNGPRTFSTE